MINKILIGFVLISTSFTSFAQSGINDTTFNPIDRGYGYGDGANLSIASMVFQDDEKIIIGGQFTSYNGINLNYLARLLPNGDIDTSFYIGTGPDKMVRTIDIQTDGKIIIGGDFTSFNGISRNRIARLNVDGSLDESFNPGDGANNKILSIVIQDDDKVIIGGQFSLFDSTGYRYLVRLNTDGSVDTNFVTGTGPDFALRDVELQEDGKIIIGGYFSNYNDKTANDIARLNVDGSLDTTFSSGDGTDSNFENIELQSDGKIIITGLFENYNNTFINRLGRLNTDGSLDTTFNIDSGAYRGINDIEILDNDKILITGLFLEYEGSGCQYIARLDKNGSFDSTFKSGFDEFGSFPTIKVQSNGKILIASDIFQPVRLNEDGCRDMSFNPGTGVSRYHVSQSVMQNDGKIIIGGHFHKYNGFLREGLARLFSDGSIDTLFNPGKGADAWVRTIAVDTGDRIFIGGSFICYDGDTVNRIACLRTDGSIDSTFKTGTGFDQVVYAITMQKDNKILVGGMFDNYNGEEATSIARLNIDGSLDTTFQCQFNGLNYLQSICALKDGKIMIGGNFSNIQGYSIKNLARLNPDGSLDTTFNPGTGPNSSVLTIVEQQDNKVLIAGYFTSYNEVEKYYFTRINEEGSLDPTFYTVGKSNSVDAIGLQIDGKIIVGGDFNQYNYSYKNSIVRLNPNGHIDWTFDIGNGADIAVRTISIQDDNRIIIGGDFTEYNGVGRNRIARIYEEPFDFSRETATICENEEYIWHQKILSSGGAYYDTLSNIHGYDSIFQLTLNVLPSYYFDDSLSICAGDTIIWQGKELYKPGIYIDSLESINGCDSILSLKIFMDTSEFNLFQDENTLMADFEADSYQWIQCNYNYDPIEGATFQSHQPTESGSYALIYTQGNCMDTTDCLSISLTNGLNNLIEDNFIVYPVPFEDRINAINIGTDEETSYEIITTSNQVISSGSFTGNTIIVTTHLDSNIYFLKLTKGTCVKIFKVVKR